MSARIISQGGDAGTVAHDFDGELVIGRASSCDLVIAAPTVSGQHASIVYDDELDAYLLEDRGSTHGTSLDGTPITGREPLGHLNVISLAGSIDLLFQDLRKCAARHGEPPAATPSPPTPKAAQKTKEPVAPKEPAPVASDGGSRTVVGHVAPPPPPPPASAQASPANPAAPAPDSTVRAVAIPPSLMDQPAGADADPAAAPAKGERSVLRAGVGGAAPLEPPTPPPGEPPAPEKVVAVQQVRLVFKTAINEIREYPLKAGDNTIGRSVSNDISRVVAEVSRSHAVISLRDGKIYLRDCGSSHGTTVNGVALTSEVEIQVGATISFGVDDARLDAE